MTNKLLIRNLIYINRNKKNNTLLWNMKLKICHNIQQRKIFLKNYKKYYFFSINIILL